MTHNPETYKVFKFKTTFYDFLTKLTNSYDARRNFVQTIISSNFNNLYLEFPVLSKKTYLNQTEFVVIEANPFQNSDWTQFKNQLKSLIDSKSDQSVTSFYNLTNDTLLVAPIPNNNSSDSSSNHLINFLKHGPDNQLHELIKIFALNALRLANDNKQVYISTHGRGVPWLHVRLSETPKYYQHMDYIDITKKTQDKDNILANYWTIFAFIIVIIIGFGISLHRHKFYYSNM